jgi:hypothetical protein
MTATTTLRELDERVNDGIRVTLLWRQEDDRAIVAVADAKTGEEFTLEVAAHQNALDVFHHPYAYAPDDPGGELAPTGG